MGGPTIWTVLLTSVLTTIGTAFVMGLKEFITSRQSTGERLRHARYLAILVVRSLDDFAKGCAAVVFDPWTTDAEGNERATVRAPDLQYPTDVDWKTIDHSLMYATLEFPSEVANAEESVRFVASDIATPPDYYEIYEERILQYGRLYDTAKRIAKRYRDTYDMQDKFEESAEEQRVAIAEAVAKVEEKQLNRRIPLAYQ